MLDDELTIVSNVFLDSKWSTLVGCALPVVPLPNSLRSEGVLLWRSSVALLSVAE
jgi:hypothetical protein